MARCVLLWRVTVLEWALAYAAAGWKVLPIGGDKRPGLSNGVHGASADPAVVKNWWAGRFEPANIAVACAGFFVLDIDPRNGGDVTLAAWERIHWPLPKTWEVATGGGGRHLYFKHDPALDGIPLGSLGKSAPGVDIKGNGNHYVLVPPSMTRERYRWHVAPCEIGLQMAPAWLLDVIRSIKYQAPVESKPFDCPDIDTVERMARAARYTMGIPGARSGEDGQTATLRACQSVARGFALDEDEAYQVLAVWNERCDPPWDERGLRRKISETLKGGTMPIGLKLVAGWEQ